MTLFLLCFSNQDEHSIQTTIEQSTQIIQRIIKEPFSLTFSGLTTFHTDNVFGIRENKVVYLIPKKCAELQKLTYCAGNPYHNFNGRILETFIGKHWYWLERKSWF